MFHFRVSNSKLSNKVALRVTNSVIILLFFRFWVTNSRLKNKKFHFELLTWWVHFYFLTAELRTWRWDDKSKKSLKYYSLNVREPLEVDTTSEISKNLITVYLGVAQACSKVGEAGMWSPTDGNLSYLCLGATYVPQRFKFKNFETWPPAIYNNGRVVNY